MEMYKAIFHISEMSKWKQVLANVTNLLNDLPKGSAEVIILANGESVKSFDMSKEGAIPMDKIKTLNDRGVTFKACNNSLTGYEIPKENLYSFVEVVSAGVSELVRKQQEGFAYIKP